MAPPSKATKKKIAKACEAMKPFGISAETVKSVLKRLLEAYEKNWTYIEDENYRVLLDAIFEPEDPKRENMKEHDFTLQDESEEEAEPPLKKTRLRSESTSSAVPVLRSETTSSSCQLRSQTTSSSLPGGSHSCLDNSLGKECMLEADSETVDGVDDHRDKERHTQFPSPLAVIHPDGSSTGNTVERESQELQLISLDEADMCNLSHFPAADNNGDVNFSVCCNEEDCQVRLYQDDTSDRDQIAEETELKVPETICLDEDDEFENMDSHEHEETLPVSSQIDVASSSNGEVKLFFTIFNPPHGFCLPSLDTVVKRVEDRYRETFRGLGTDFSLLELLKEMCENILEQGPISDGNEQSVLRIPDNVKKFEIQGDWSSLSNGLAADHNPTLGILQIPRPLVASAFNHLRSVKGLRLDGNSFGPQTLDIDASSGSSSLFIVPKDKCLLDRCNNHYFVADITRGLENQEISLINEFNDEKLPAFTYIPKNINYKTGNVKFMLARISNKDCCSDCFGDCLSPDIPCACAAETGGLFAYINEGLLKESFLKSCIAINQKPKKENYFYCDNCPLERMKETIESGSCRGHLLRTFIKECWYKCGCGLNCGNRVVQRGIKARLQVFMTPEGKGWGLRTLEDLPSGAFICEYVGEIVTNTELFQRNAQNKNEKHTYPVLLDADWSSEGILRDEEALCLDATSFGNVARFINHRCSDANMVEVPVEVESPDRHYYHLAFFTTRHVKAMEELTWDYGIDFDDNSHPVKAFECRCGSKFCTNLKRKKRTRRSQRH